MQISSSTSGNALVVTVDEVRLDAAVAMQFKDRMKVLVGNRPRQVILDLSEVEFVDSSGLGSIVGVMKAMGRARRLDLVGLSPAVAKVFRMTRMDSVFRIFPTVDAALEDIANAS